MTIECINCEHTYHRNIRYHRNFIYTTRHSKQGRMSGCASNALASWLLGWQHLFVANIAVP